MDSTNLENNVLEEEKEVEPVVEEEKVEPVLEEEKKVEPVLEEEKVKPVLEEEKVNPVLEEENNNFITLDIKEINNKDLVILNKIVKNNEIKQKIKLKMKMF